MMKTAIVALLATVALPAFAESTWTRAREIAGVQAVKQRQAAQWTSIQQSAQMIHPSDRQRHIANLAKQVGLPAHYYQPVYYNLGRTGANGYTARDLVTKPGTPTYRR